VDALRETFRQHPIAAPFITVLAIMFVLVPLIGLVLYATLAGSGRVTPDA
jgi:hypothetical protein